MSHPGASLRPGRSREHLATDSVRSKLFPQSVSARSLPVSRAASRDFVALDRPLDDGRVQTANVVGSTSTVSANIIHDLISMFWENDPCISDICKTYTSQKRRICLTSMGEGIQWSFTQAAPNELKLGEGGEDDKQWPTARWWRRNVFVRHGLEWEDWRFGASVCKRTHTLLEYPRG